jgi:hypothetical protein
MKKFLLLYGLLTTWVAFGQDSIPNRNFERWDTNTYDYLQNYPYSSNPQNFYYYQLPFNVTKTTDAYHGNYAVQLTTNASETDTAFGYFLNANPNTDGGPSSWKGGIPYNQQPTGIKGYYKYNVATADSGTILVVFKKTGSVIGMYTYPLGGIKSSYTMFDFTFDPALPEAPDTVILGAISCKFADGDPHGIAGSTLLLDSISFTGVASQPSMLNGDFESWQSQIISSLADWNTSYNGGDSTGVYKTTDAVQGDYALELMTYQGNWNNHDGALPARVSTGYYPSDCNSNCTELGGSPFSNQIDTLAFYYKYAPSGDDSAAVNLNFKKNGANIFSTGIYLPASENYKYIEISFDIGQDPDTVIVDIQSSIWNDTALTYVGSDLKIDHIYFKSSPMTKTPVITWNNPADITYGTLLSATQLNATADVPGIFVYTPEIGTKLGVGSNQSLKADFAPTDTIDYVKTSKTVTINVLEAINDISSVSLNGIKFYPNPVVDNLTIDSPVNISSVIVTNIVGEIVYYERPVSKLQITISTLELGPGLYYVTVNNDSSGTTTKLVVKSR